MQRAYGLDVLRGTSILMVLIVHTQVMPMWRHLEEAAILDLMPWFRIMHIGMFGMDIFFVLSGFLVISMLMNEIGRNGRLDFKRYWLRRGLKIWPSFYLGYGTWAILNCALLWWKGGAAAITEFWSQAWVNLVFIQNYVNMDARWFASWSLAVEEQFYTALPLLVILLLRGGNTLRLLPLICLGGIAASFIMRLGAAELGQITEIWRQTHLRMDSLLCGVILGFVYVKHQDLWERLQRYRWWFLVLGLSGLGLLYYLLLMGREVQVYSWGMTVAALSASGFLLFCFGIRNQKVLDNPVLRLMRQVGLYSYSIYICQVFGWRLYSIDKYTEGTMFSQWPLGAIAFWVASIGLGIILHRLVEQPTLLLRDRLLPSKGSPIKNTGSEIPRVIRLDEQRVSP